MLLSCGVGEDSWESLGLQGDPVLNIHWKDWCWSWNSKTLAIWCEELTHWKRPWCWERLKAGEGDNRGWDGWMASLTQWTWVWVGSGVGDGQGGLAWCSPWGSKDLDTTELLNWTDSNELELVSPWGFDLHWRKKWQPTPVFLLGKSHGQRSLLGSSSQSCKSQIWLSD